MSAMLVMARVNIGICSKLSSDTPHLYNLLRSRLKANVYNSSAPSAVKAYCCPRDTPRIFTELVTREYFPAILETSG